MPRTDPEEIDYKAEIEALKAILAALEPLTKEQKTRLLRCAKELFDLYIGE